MRRRDFITLISGGVAAAWPHRARAQQKKMYRVGVLALESADAVYSASFRTVLREELRKSGYVEEQNVLIDFKSAEGRIDQLPKLADELVALKVDVIVALLTPSAHAAQQATREVPIVFNAGDAVGSGLVDNLARPGGKHDWRVGISIRTARQMRRTIPRNAAIGTPYRRSYQCR